MSIGTRDGDIEIIRESPFNAEAPARALRPAITPSRNVYVRSNFDVPLLGDDHAVLVGGAVSSPFEIAVAGLRALPQRTVLATMECAGNDRLGMRPLPPGEPWRHGALSTVTWTGVPLSLLLERAGVAAGALEVETAGADSGPRDDSDGLVRFARSVPLADAMHPDTLLALAMNGEPLTPSHGAPVRLVVPGWYGMANVKWVSHIEARTTPFQGYFQRKRYVYDEAGTVAPVTRVRVKSMITTPADGASCPRNITAEGWAWSGTGAITRVEVAVDGGEGWTDATLGRPSSPHAWTPWHCPLTLDHAGRYSLRSRATDSAGNVQPDTIVWNRLGYGNNAVRAIIIEAR